MSRFTELMAQHGQYHLIKNNLKEKKNGTLQKKRKLSQNITKKNIKTKR